MLRNTGNLYEHSNVMAQSEVRRAALLGVKIRPDEKDIADMIGIGPLGKPLLTALFKQPQFTVTVVA